MQKTRAILIGCLVTLSLLAVSGMMFSFSAVDAQVLPLPEGAIMTATAGLEGIGLTLAPDEELVQKATLDAHAATWAAELSNRTIFDFNVAYLIVEGAASSDSLVSAESIAGVTGASVISKWEDFIAQNAQQPFHIVLIHGSMYDQVDKAWMSSAYRNKIFVVGINMPFANLADLVNDRCLQDPNPGALENFGNLYLYFTFDVELENESYRELVTQSELETCNDDYTGTGFVSVNHGTVSLPIINQELLQNLVSDLISDTVSYGFPKPGDTQSLPTVIPLPSQTDN